MIPFEEERHNLMAYQRKADKDVLVIGNFQREKQSVTLPKEMEKVLLNNYPDMEIKGRELTLEGYQAVVLEMK